MILRERVRCTVPLVGSLAILVLALVALPSWSNGQAPVDESAAAEPQVATEPAIAPVAPSVDAPIAVEPAEPGAAAPPVTIELTQQDPVFVPTVVDVAAPGPNVSTPFDFTVNENAAGANDGQLQDIEARLAKLLAEVQALRGNRGPAVERVHVTGNREVRYVARAAQSAPRMVARIQRHGPAASQVQTLTRARYKLPAGKAEALAAFIREHIKADVDSKVEGEVLQITADPDSQARIGQFIELLLDPRQRRVEVHAVGLYPPGVQPAPGAAPKGNIRLEPPAAQEPANTRAVPAPRR